MRKILLSFLLLSSLLWSEALAQERTVRGKVMDTNTKTGIPGVSVIVKNTTTGTVTDANGNFSIVAQPQNVLEFRVIGYLTQEVIVGEQSTFEISLAEDVQQLGEIVITALGLEQEKRSLTYSVQNVKGDELLKSREVNVVNALNSKVAGVQITSLGGSAGAGSGIRIRGINSFGGARQPLFVVDGIPINNTTRTTSSAASVDVPNRAIDINPDDIETISVLKGPAAAALYGVQGGSGVVLITTKRGSQTDKRTTSVNFSSSFSVETVNKLFELQDEFAQGTGGVYNDAPGSTFMFGPRFSDLRYSSQFDARYPQGRIVPATDPTARANAVVTPFDNQESFWQAGNTANNHFSIQSGNRDGNLYFSVGHLNQTGIIPLNSFARTTIKLSGEANVTNKIKVGASISYVNSGGRRVGRGDNFTGVVQGLYRTPRNFDIFNGQSSPTNPIAFRFPNGSQRHFRNQNQIDGMNPSDLGLGPDSPLWTVNNNPFNDRVDRLFGFARLSYQILPWLNVMGRVGTDVSTDQRTHAFDIGSFGADGRFGRIFQDTYIDRIINSDLIITANKSFGKFNFNWIIGHNFYNQVNKSNYIDGNTFNQPGIFNINNATIISNPVQRFSSFRTFGVYTNFRMDYENMAFLELTGRNEWTSTLPTENNSFFFPAVSAGVFLNDLFKIPEQKYLTYAKIRASYAFAGNGAPGTYLTDTYFVRASASDGFGNGISFPLRSNNVGGTTLSNTLGNNELKPELTATLELGADIALFKNRISIDFTYYRSRSTNQIVRVTYPTSSGFSGKFINAGELENKGIEVVLNTKPLKIGSFNWDLSFNFTRNRNVVISLTEGLPEILLPGFGTIFQPRLVPGQQYGVFYGSGWRRNEQGTLIIGADGFPIRQDNLLIGNPNPDFLLGIRNTFTYKNLSLTFLWDIRQGGDVWNGTEAVMTNVGATVRTEQRGQQIVFDGVLANGERNTQAVTLTQANWFQNNGRATGASGVHEQFIEDASWVRLRDINLTYRLPSKLLGRTKFIKAMDITVFGRNLLLFTKYSGVDPENNLYGISGSNGLDYFGNPNTRSMGASLNITF
ncbi:MAG: SusC/RagA family TonB-linked outer membrane protein [Microscillaceae bacterium]|jgi:TonB-linked SusC/RagA family outer membrane protein|nr:SusC/RagA family TonB-linked outer membrane protein [Microscillaceae bacterium]